MASTPGIPQPIEGGPERHQGFADGGLHLDSNVQYATGSKMRLRAFATAVFDAEHRSDLRVDGAAAATFSHNYPSRSPRPQYGANASLVELLRKGFGKILAEHGCMDVARRRRGHPANVATAQRPQHTLA